MSPARRDKPLSHPGCKGFSGDPSAPVWRSGLAISAYLIVSTLLLPGCGRREIVRPTPQMDIESQFWVRVLLLSNAAECTLEVPSAFRLLRPDLGPAIEAGQPLTEAARDEIRIGLAGGRLTLGRIVLPESEVVVDPESPHVFRLNGQDYRGRLKLAVDDDGRTLSAINLIPLEPYLAGVVGAEMPDYWEPQALRAQAIAARTYCLYVKNRFGANRRYDVSRTQASQVYNGIRAESSQVWSAVNSTHGKILVTDNPGPESRWGLSVLSRGVFPTYYSSVCGGHTADSEKVFGESFGPLTGVPCPHCKRVAKLGLFFWPMTHMDRQTVTKQLTTRYAKLKALGAIKSIAATEKSDYGEFSRLARIELVGETGKTETLGAEELRLALDPTGRKIKSTICHIVPWGDGWAFLAGRGWGHGVGMCQHGAEGLARLGRSAEEILLYYYPGAKIVSLY